MTHNTGTEEDEYLETGRVHRGLTLKEWFRRVRGVSTKEKRHVSVGSLTWFPENEKFRQVQDQVTPVRLR